MFDVGFWELVLIFGVGLIILGPERMPRVASQIGRWIGRARRTASSLRRQLEQEIATADYKPPPPPKRKPNHITPVNGPNAAEDDRGAGDPADGDPADDDSADDRAESAATDGHPQQAESDDESRREKGES